MARTIHPAGLRVSQWGEGPLWWNDALLYVDIRGKTVVRFDPATGLETAWDCGERVGTVVPRASGGFVIAGDHGFSFLDPTTGVKTPIADPEADKKPQNRFNDGKCDPAGRFWAGTMSTVRKTGDAALYTLDPDLTVKLQFPGVTTSNGLVWNAAADTLYYIDTPRKSVLAFDFDLRAGSLSNPRTVLDTAATGYNSSPDGMAIDAEGHLWIAFCHGGCVACFDAATGAQLDRIDFPCVETTAVAFGGPGLKTLFVTTGINAERSEPLAGRLLAVEMDVAGVPAFAFAG